MLDWLPKAAREMREDAGRRTVHIAAPADLDVSTVNRFENGLTIPQHLDKLIAAYASEIEIEPIEIWQYALALWENST
jgi:hypothetical protein